MLRKIPRAVLIYGLVTAGAIGGIFLWDYVAGPSRTPNPDDPAVRARAAAQSITGEPTVRRELSRRQDGWSIEARSKYYAAAATREGNREYLATEGRLIVQLILNDLPEISEARVELYEGRRRLATVTVCREPQYDQYTVLYESDLR